LLLKGKSLKSEGMGICLGTKIRVYMAINLGHVEPIQTQHERIIIQLWVHNYISNIRGGSIN
jgi:hypothetical protein